MNQLYESWRSIEGYEGKYEVSNLGRIKSLKRVDPNNHPIRERILKLSRHKTGYLLVSLCKDGVLKKYWVARIVAKAFVKNPDDKPEVNHRNEVVDDNRAINLEWVTPKENTNYGTHNARVSMSNSKQVFQYDRNYNLVKVWSSTIETRSQGFHQANVSSCCLGKRKTHKGFIWSYIELIRERGDLHYVV